MKQALRVPVLCYSLISNEQQANCLIGIRVVVILGSNPVE